MTTRSLLGLVLLAGCALHRPVVAAPQEPEPDTEPVTRYNVPWNANDNSLVCADTVPSIPWMACMTVREFRHRVLDPKL